MCGRYKISTKAPQIVEAFHVDDVGLENSGYEIKERFNVAPTDPVPVVRIHEGKRTLLPMRWGMIPFWAKDASIGVRMINARVETLFEKPAFRESLEKRRCLVISDGFYEWLKQGKDKQAHLLCFDDRHVFAFAGLWAKWKGPAGPIESVSVITTPPNTLASRVHDRMPLIFDPKRDEELIGRWLDTKESINLAELQVPRDLPGFTAFPVDKRVGNVRNDDPTLAEPLA